MLQISEFATIGKKFVEKRPGIQVVPTQGSKDTVGKFLYKITALDLL